MKKALTLMAMVLTLGLALNPLDAEAAKRLGGGKSTGTQRQMTTNTPATPPTQAPAAAPTAAAKAPTAAPAATTAPKRSWMGPLAGLAAGLGLAALASHFGFGEELASMLMFGLLAMAVVAVIGVVLRKRAAAQQPALAGAHGPSGEPSAQMLRRYDVAMPDTRGSAVQGSAIGSAIPSAANPAPADPAAPIPADFDVAAFVRNAKVQFIRLQVSHDAANLDDLREFTTPEMFAELQTDLSERGATPQRTEVISLDATVLDVTQEVQRYVVSVRFTGTIREAAGAAPEAFDEVWHLVKPRTGGQGWVLAGIQQTQG